MPDWLRAQEANHFIINDESTNEINTLDVEWQFFFGDFLSAQEMDSLHNPQYVKIPHTWKNTIDPNSNKYPGKGFGTYYLRLIIPETAKDLALDARIAGTNYRLYINDVLVGELGKVSKNEKEAQSAYKNIIYRIPDGHNGELRIVYHISNFEYRKGGLWRTPMLSTYDKLYERKTQKNILTFFLVGAILFMGIYHIGMKLFKNKAALEYNFAMVCFLTVLRTVSVGEYILIEYLKLPWWLTVRIEFISFYLVLGYTVRFIYTLFPGFIPKKLSNVVFVISMAASVATVVLPVYYASFLIPFMQVVTITSGLSLLVIIAKESLKGDKEVIVAFVGLLVLFIVTIIEILIHHSQLSGDVIFSLGVFAYLFSHVVIMSNRLNKNYKKTEMLSIALKKVNSELEQKVMQRTAQLDEQNEALKESNLALKKINEEKDGLMHMVAHDLKSPLNTTLGFLQILKNEGSLQEEQKEYLDIMEKSSRQGLQFINDLLTLYSLEDRKETKTEVLELNRLLNDCVKRHKELAGQKRIELIPNFNHIPKGVYFNTDKQMFHRLLDNLLSNAFKFSYPKSKVWFEAYYEQDCLHLSVKDEGLGIMEVEQDKIFKKFQKMSNKPTGNETSSGLGLSIVKQLVESLQAEIRFESEYQKGTTFFVRLPNLKPL